MTTISFIRHGATEWNAAGKFMSRTDLPMSSSGEFEVQQSLSLLHQLSPPVVVASPSLRARQTAKIIVDDLGLPDFGVSDDLAEVDFGLFEGHTADELKSGQHSAAFAEWQNPDSTIDGVPEGESWSDVAHRASRVLEHFGQNTHDTLIVSHGYFIRAVLVAALGGLHPRNLRRLELSNTGITAISNNRGYWRMEFHNATSRSPSRSE